MKKYYHFLLFIISYISIYAQEASQEPNVIYANTTKNVSLIFTNPIKKAVLGSDNFKFGYNKVELSSIGILKASAGEESNLLVITENGNIFSFITRYSKDVKVLTHFISDDMAVGNEKGNLVKNKIQNKNDLPKGDTNKKPVEQITINSFETNIDKDSTEVYNKICINEISKPVYFKRIYSSKDDILLRLKNVTYQNNEIYVTLRIQNNSTLDYDINYLNFYIASRNKNKNTTSQTIPYKPKHIYNLKPSIKNGEYLDVIYVYQKFTINENKILLVEITEQNGERNLQLEILNTIINNPNK